MTVVIPHLSEATIRDWTTEETLRHGYQHYRRGAVLAPVLRGNLLTADIEDAQYYPYHVTIFFDDEGINQTSCTCSQSGESWCKHRVALAFFCLEKAEAIEVRPTLLALLNMLNCEQLQRLVLRLAEDNNGLVDLIEEQVALMD